MTTENEEIEFNNQDENEEKVIEYKTSSRSLTTRQNSRFSKVRSICFYTL